MIINEEVERRSPYIMLSHKVVQECISYILPNRIVENYDLAKTGLSNTNYIISLDDKRKVVLRVYPKKDTIKRGKELKISELLIDFPEVPKIHQPPSFTYNSLQWDMVDFVDGITLAEAQSLDHNLLLEAYFEIGIILAKLKNITFPACGLLNEKLEVQEIKTITSDFHPIVNFIMDCLNDKNLIERVGVNLQNELCDLVIKQEHILYKIEHKNHLVHGDFKVENILVKRMKNGHMHLSGV
ncbi:MAG: phosphotransferase [Janthinobacterium lividum]